MSSTTPGADQHCRAPTVLAGTLHVTSRLAAGAVAFSVLAAATAIQSVLGSWPPLRQLGLGLVVMPGGLALIALGVTGAWTSTSVGGALVAGLGVGLVFNAVVGWP